MNSLLYALQFANTPTRPSCQYHQELGLSAITFLLFSNATGPTLDGILLKSQTIELLFFCVERPHALGNRYIVMLLLLVSGKVQPNPGPVDTIQSLPNPYDFKNRAGFGLLYVNVRSLFPKIDMIRIWAKTINADIMVLSEIWLKKSVSNNSISIDGYTVF